MELKWLEDFLSLAATQSFSRSAHERHVTQSALSRRIRQLENWLCVPLFDRSTYPVRVTAEGKAFLPKATELVGLVHSARRDIRHQHAVTAEVLTFATLNTLALTFFPDWIRRLEGRGHLFKTHFGEQRSSFAGKVSMLLDGESDFFLTYAHPNVPTHIDPERFSYRCLGTEAAIPVSVPDANGNAVHALCPSAPAIAYLSYGTGSFFGRGLVKLLAERPLPLTTVYENAMSAGLKAMALAGCGVGWIPESLVGEELKSGQLVVAGDASWHLPTEIRLYRASGRCRPAVERFWAAIDDVDQRVENHPSLSIAGAA
ncbi:LysR family transcriptional regulator [Tardiphaga sp.]|uniref:LysR family transcriptional regulator n=1 Tax=Tardiphaga sp. TaxID=1926292 RepID=UPI00198F5005|nr:LysR family transcriptional regulator [Tardiphaga sp.]MBC7578738.1 LysR family transcriptional regulator [Tardiphaga sp.]